MNVHLLHMILSGIAYIMLVFCMTKMMRHTISYPQQDDDGDGGRDIPVLPELDLPPGVTLPGSAPTVHKKEEPEPEEIF